MQQTNVKLDIQTKSKIAKLTIKGRFRRKKGGKNKNRQKHSNTCTKPLTKSLDYRHLKSLPKLTVLM